MFKNNYYKPIILQGIRKIVHTRTLSLIKSYNFN